MSAGPKPETDAAAGAKPKGGKKKLIIMVLAVLLLGGGGAGAWFSGVLPKLLGKAPAGDYATEAEHGGKPEAKGEAKAEAKAEGKGKPEGKPEAKAEGKGKGEGKADAKADANSPFMDLPDIIANLNGGPKRSVFVKLRTKLELAQPEDKAAVQAAMPRVLDLFQGYLREMRPEELRGTASTYRLREELLARTNVAAAPAHVVAVLFTEIIVQ